MASVAQVAQMRAHAESRMVDQCRVITNPDATVWDPTTLADVPAPAMVTYAGPVLIKAATNQPGERDLTNQPIIVTALEAHFPVALSSTIVTGNVIEITESSNDPGMVGRRYRVAGPQAGTFIAARRLPIEEYTGG